MSKPWQDPLWMELQHDLTARMSGPLELSHDKQAFQLVEAIWPKIEAMRTNLLAWVLEFEHALEHVTDEHKGIPHCVDCQTLAKSALDGVNRGDFLEIAGEEADDVRTDPYTQDSEA